MIWPVQDMSVKCHGCKDTRVVSVALPTHPHLAREWPCPDCRRVVSAALVAAADELAAATDDKKVVSSQDEVVAWAERLRAARAAYLNERGKP